jgi:hypothetical protein
MTQKVATGKNGIASLQWTAKLMLSSTEMRPKSDIGSP